MTENEPLRSESEEQDARKADESFFGMWGDLLWAGVQERFQDVGRGAAVVDMATATHFSEERDQAGHNMFLNYGYLDQRNVEEMGKPDLIRKVRTYDPTHEFIVIFIRDGETRSYRVRHIPDENQRMQNQATG